MGLFSRIFKLKNKNNKVINFDKIKSGDFVFVRFKTPYEIGLISDQNLTLTRLNPEETSIREVKGIVTSNIVSQPPLKSRIIEVATYSSPSMPGFERKITFLEEEIEEIRKVNE